MRRHLLLLGAALSMTVCGLPLRMDAAQAASSPPAPAPSPVPHQTVAPVVLAHAEMRMMTARVTGYGTIQSNPNDLRTVTAPYAAVIAQMMVRTGEPVSRGDALAKLSPSPAQALAYSQAKAQVTYAEAELARAKKLLHQQLATRAQVAQAQNALNMAQGKLSTLEKVGAGKSETVLTAPVDGTITVTSAETGQVLTQGAPILTIAPRHALAVVLGVEPEDVAGVRKGMAVSLHDVLDPAGSFHGTVTAVGAAVDPKTQLVDILVQLAPTKGNSATPLLGRFVTGQIDLQSERVVTVPRSAILQDTKGAYLFVVNNGVAQRVDVTPGLETDRVVAVPSALKPGMQVVVQGNYELQDGMQVRVVGQ